MNLRPYQSAALRKLAPVLHQRPILVAPTGSGKTVMASHFVRTLGAPALWVAHRRELIYQGAKSLRRLRVPVRVIMGSDEADPFQVGLFGGSGDDLPPVDPSFPTVHVASVQTLQRRQLPAGVKVIFVDEAHHATADGYSELFAQKIPVVGLTATPFRLDGKPLGDMFGAMVVAAHVDELVAEGVLHAPRVFCAEAPDLTGVKTTAGEYNLGDLARKMNKPSVIGDVLGEWIKHATTKDGRGMRTVCFAINVEHSQAIVAGFREMDVAAEHVDGNTPSEQRDAILARLASGETTVVSNCMVLTEGWDLPSLECAIIARPTESLNLHLQMIGRVMRAAESKTGAIVLDHAGNHHRHGLVTRRLEYSLSGSVRSSTGGEPLGLKRCNVCGLMVALNVTICPECGCGMLFGAAGGGERGIRQGDGALVAFDDTSFEYRAGMYRRLLAEAMDSNRSEGWASVKFNERFGYWPVVADGELVDPPTATMRQKESVYEGLVKKADEKGFKTGWASWKYKEIFGVWPQGFVQNVRARQLTDKWQQAV